MGNGNEGSGSTITTANSNATQSNNGGAGKDGPKKSYTSNGCSNRTILATCRKRRGCPSTPKKRLKGPGKIHDSYVPSGENSQTTTVCGWNSPSVSGDNEISETSKNLGLPRSTRREPQGRAPSCRPGAGAKEPQTRPLTPPCCERVVGYSAPRSIPPRNIGHAPPLPRHGNGIEHHGSDRPPRNHIPSSQRRLQGFLNGDFGDEDCPSAEDLQKAFPSLRQYQKRHLPIVVKKVDTIKESALWTLPSVHKDCLQFARQQWQWITSEEPYKALKLPPPRLRNTGFTAEEERRMTPQKIEILQTPPLGTVYGFKIGEYFKGRSRPVWACHINDSITTAPHYHLQNQAEVSRTIGMTLFQEDPIFVQFDLTSMYDQLKLAPIVRPYFAFRGRNGETLALNCLPMGLSVACAVAQATSWQLLNFDRRASAIVYIDNIAFCGRRGDVIADVQCFLARCREVNATLNEVDVQQVIPVEQIEALHTDIFTFLGVEYRWSSREKTLSTKTREKITTLRGILRTATLTTRQVATILGVCRYASAILGKKLFEFHTVFNWARRLGTMVQSRPQAWDEYVFLPYREEMGRMMEDLLSTQPVPIYMAAPATRPLTLITDASKSGYGGVLVAPSGAINCTAGSFKKEFPSSVQAEPEGMVKAALDLLPQEASDVLILLDHQPLVYAAKSNAPKAFSYNQALGALAEARPNTRFYFAFVPGVRNVADGLSRGDTTVDAELASIVAGTGWSSALHSPVCRKCGLVR
eukprot:Tbor_TRINITY_DN6155_c3_g4::TRINITY_DN6155_c3_g4_i13::g.22680::m.22680